MYMGDLLSGMGCDCGFIIQERKESVKGFGQIAWKDFGKVETGCGDPRIVALQNVQKCGFNLSILSICENRKIVV